MNWSKVKNLLIVMLIAANLFLLWQIAAQTRSRSYIAPDEIADACALLGERGLLVSEAIVPTKRFVSDIYESEYTGDSYFTDTAYLLSGIEYKHPLYMPDGGFLFTSEDGSRIEFDSEFGFSYIKNSNSLTKAYTDVGTENFDARKNSGKEVSASQRTRLEELTLGFLSRGIRTDEGTPFGITVTDAFADPDSGIVYCKAIQTLNGYPVWAHEAVCTFSGETLLAASGRWYFRPLKEKSYTTELADQINILFTDLTTVKNDLAEAAGESGIPFPLESTGAADIPAHMEPGASASWRVTSLSACYTLYWNADKTALFFIPAWQINHVNGETIVYNAANSTIYQRQ